MVQVNIHEAKTRLSALIEMVASGESFIIAKAGKPMAKVIPYSTSKKPLRQTGFMANEIVIPKDFDTMLSSEITEMFYGEQV